MENEREMERERERVRERRRDKECRVTTVTRALSYGRTENMTVSSFSWPTQPQQCPRGPVPPSLLS